MSKVGNGNHIAGLALAFAALLVGSTAIAGPIVSLPNFGDVAHFDLNAGTGAIVLDPLPSTPAAPTPVLGGPCGAGPASVGCNFVDTLVSDSPLLWQTELNNPNPFPMVFNLGFFFPSSSLIGTLGLAPGDSALFTIAVSDAAFETGEWLWSAANGLSNAILLLDASVSENIDPLPGVGNGDFTFLASSGNSFFVESPSDTPNFALTAVGRVPAPPSWFLLVGGLVTLCGRSFRRR